MRTMREPGRAENGLTSEFIAPSAYRVWALCMAVDTPWEGTEQEAWDRVATIAIRTIDDNIITETPMSASSFSKALFACAYGPNDKWPELNIREKKAWETVGRHIINCLDADPGAVDPEKIELLSVKWFVKQLEGDLQ